MKKLLITALGRQDSGKSTTWNTLFGRTVRTRKDLRRLDFPDGSSVEVFLVSGSPEERGKYVGDILNDSSPAIVLCSMQYIEGVKDSFNYFINLNYDLFVQWLNPGFWDRQKYSDRLSIESFITNNGGTFEIEDGKVDPSERVQKISSFLYAWAKNNNLLRFPEAGQPKPKAEWRFPTIDGGDFRVDPAKLHAEADAIVERVAK